MNAQFIRRDASAGACVCRATVEIARLAGNVLSIPIAEAANAMAGRQALLEADEAAIGTAAAIRGTPRIIFGLRATVSRCRNHKKC
jgi:hypothetical protein